MYQENTQECTRVQLTIVLEVITVASVLLYNVSCIIKCTTYVCILHCKRLYLVPPEITTDVTDVIENGTNPVTFTCRAIGEPLPNINWYFNGNMTNPSNAIEINTTRTSERVIESSLTIINPQSSDVGNYTCHTENVIGSDRSSGMLLNGIYKNAHLAMLTTY